MRSSGRVPVRNQIPLVVFMFKICNVFHHFGRACLAEHSVRNVWRAPSLRSVPLLERCFGHPSRPSRPRIASGFAPSEFTPPRSSRSAPSNPARPHREHLQSSKLVSSVAGCAMHMRWPDGIRRGSRDRQNPKQERANNIQALPVLTGHAVKCPHAS